MKPDTVLDYAVFQLSPKRSRCELIVSSDGKSEKLASGLVKPFVTHLKVAEEQVALSVQSIKLEVERWRHAEKWFTKGTLERFVRFVSTPEILELVNTFETEMSQLEAAQRLYSQGVGDQLSGTGGAVSGVTAASDATKKELLRAIDVRLAAVKQDLTAAFTRAAAAGFNLDTVSELQTFADQFGAHRLKEACSKFISLCERRSGLINPLKGGANDFSLRSSYGSDMSIDEDSTTPKQPSAESHKQSHSDPAKHTKSASITFPLRESRDSSMEREDIGKESIAVVEKEKKEENPSEQDGATPGAQLTRRLSVKDRINLFESQKKENSGGSGKPVVGRSGELRRQSSDIPEKAVLRRWSGASDMSIDLSGEKKDTESPLCTPSSATVSQAKFEDQGRLTLNNLADPGKPEFKSVSGRAVDSGSRDQTEIQSRVVSPSTREEIHGPKQFTSSNSGTRNQHEDNKDKEYSEALFRSLPGSKPQILDLANRDLFIGSKPVNELSRTRGRVNSETNPGEPKDLGATQTESKSSTAKGEGFMSGDDSNQAGRTGFRNQKEELEYRDELVSQSHGKVFQGPALDSERMEAGTAVRSGESFASQFKGTEGNSKLSLSKWRSMMVNEEDQMKMLASSDNLAGSFALSMEDSRPQNMNFEKHVSDPEQVKRGPGRSNENNSAYGNRKMLLSAKIALQPPQGSDSFSTPPVSLVQRARQSKGNQELNDELKMKANELEKLFSVHKLRVPGDSSSTRKNRDMQSELGANASYQEAMEEDDSLQLLNNYKSIEPTESSNILDNFNATPPMKIVRNWSGDALSNNFSELSVSDASRGKLYERYMHKRNQKLREEWSSGKAEKEAKLKAMHDIFERSRADIEAKFSRSADRKDSAFTSRRRAERLRSFNSRSQAGKEQQRLDFGQSDDDDDVADFQGPNFFGKDRSFSDKLLGDDPSKSAANKKLLPSKSLTSSTPRTSSAPVPRSASKASNVGSGRRKMQADNPLAQSVPNFTEIRKENTKPSSAVSKTSRSQLRNNARSKSTNEEVSTVKEEKPRRSQFLRKSYVNPGEISEISSMKPEDIGLAPSKYEETEHCPYDHLQKQIEAPSFLRKGNGKDFSSRISSGKQTTDILNNEEESDNGALLPDSSDVLNDKEVDAIVNGSHFNIEDTDPRLSPESEKMMNSSSENGDAVRSFSREDSSVSANLPAVSGFRTSENMHDSPEESPVSWNLRAQHPFSYPQEISDVDASADSPLGSPVSWNSHSLSQLESDAARMRKKWGTAQKPMLVTNASNNQSRKDMTSGFKRLLKFGRKSRGAENLADWISATTSEGDDDTEDGRDPAYRSSEDLRRSRMGFSQGHPSDESFNESEFFNEQVQSLQSSIPAPPPNFKIREDHLAGSSIKAPRSFFSLSTFRSKGSDSKPR